MCLNFSCKSILKQQINKISLEVYPLGLYLLQHFLNRTNIHIFSQTFKHIFIFGCSLVKICEERNQSLVFINHLLPNFSNRELCNTFGKMIPSSPFRCYFGKDGHVLHFSIQQWWILNIFVFATSIFHRLKFFRQC